MFLNACSAPPCVCCGAGAGKTSSPVGSSGCATSLSLGLWTPGAKEFGDEGGRHVHFAFAADPGSLDELVERLREHAVSVRGPEEHPGGDRSIYVEDPEGNVVEVWDFFHRGEGARDGTHAFSDG